MQTIMYVIRFYILLNFGKFYCCSRPEDVTKLLCKTSVLDLRNTRNLLSLGGVHFGNLGNFELRLKAKKNKNKNRGARSCGQEEDGES